MNRRTILTAAPVAVFLPTVPIQAACAAPVETQIMALYRRYVGLTDAARTHPSQDDDELDALFYDERDLVEAEMMAIPPTSAQDMAAKTLVSHCHGC